MWHHHMPKWSGKRTSLKWERGYEGTIAFFTPFFPFFSGETKRRDKDCFQGDLEIASLK